MNDNRADSFLRLIRRSQRGRLKIYLGYAAGVGKTYQMLLEARRMKEDGIDVAVGLVETHNRAETDALLEGLELIPRRTVTYRGIMIEEMDSDAIIARHPQVVLIDELAHSNVPGSRNTKRYQDVEEVLSAGIHVISTLNIQHMESLYETIERITRIKVRERIPDHIVAEADQLVNVDITTEDLRRRLKEGKIYTRERIDTAMDHFFQPMNLEQLRELTLRELAAQIDSRRHDSFSDDISSSPDQIMVCLSSKGPNREALLRYTSRLAGKLNRNWYAVYVQTSREDPTVIDAATQRMLSDTLTLAQQLGATVFTYKGDDVAKTILQFAKEYHVGHIVIGTSGKRMSFLRRLKGERSIAERLINEGTGIIIVVVDTRTIPNDRPANGHIKQDETTDHGIQAKKDRTNELETVLSDRCILFWDKAIQKDKAMRELLEACVYQNREYHESAWTALLEREKKGGTFIGEDVAIPHARIPELHNPLVAIGIDRAGIHDNLSGLDAKIMFLLLSPTDPPEIHVKMLGMISRVAQNDRWRKMILSAGNLSEIRKLLLQ
jgi:two-component system, OmpR family, sensor histidine kinase KdpD